MAAKYTKTTEDTKAEAPKADEQTDWGKPPEGHFRLVKKSTARKGSTIAVDFPKKIKDLKKKEIDLLAIYKAKMANQRFPLIKEIIE